MQVIEKLDYTESFVLANGALPTERMRLMVHGQRAIVGIEPELTEAGFRELQGYAARLGKGLGQDVINYRFFHIPAKNDEVQGWRLIAERRMTD